MAMKVCSIILVFILLLRFQSILRQWSAHFICNLDLLVLLTMSRMLP